MNQKTPRQPVLHPFLFALFPILALFVQNLGQVGFFEITRPVLLTLGAAGLVLMILRAWWGNWRRAGLGAALAAVLFFTFGHVQRLLSLCLGRENLAVISVGLVIAWGALLVAGLFRISHLRGDLVRLTYVLNRISFFALLTCLWGAGAYGVRAFNDWDMPLLPAEETALPLPTDEPIVVPTTLPSKSGPDIYWIVLDGYGRADMLDEVYDLDNSAFITSLEERGFYVASQATSNYAQTALSLSSTLNLDYIDQFIELDPDPSDRSELTGLINQSVLVDVLKENGYQTFAFSNGFPVTQMESADNFISSEGEMNSFEMAMLASSLGEGPQLGALRDQYRERVIWQIDQMKQIAAQESVSPRFVFLHLILPHPPFLFPVDEEEQPSLAGGDGTHAVLTPDEYVEEYREQLLYTNQVAGELIDSILQSSGGQAIILLQGDHGPGSHLDWDSIETTCMRERFSILSAYYFPDQNYVRLSQNFTPVNSFRVVLNQFFKADLPLLPDHAYFSTWERPYEFNEVSHRLKQECVAR